MGDKAGVVLGMSMTEKQGGSDVRANTTFARRLDTVIVCPLVNG
jgi:putative acyl-CoA dehydrogenase